MKLLHTSDWHIGRTLFGRKRYDEFSSFLSWLIDTLQHHQIEVLIVAGDIFDTTTPSNRAQRLYYQFLKDASETGCRHIIISGGNHDSPSLLEAPKELLRTFQVHVVASVPADINDEVLVLKDEKGRDTLIVCAVPYLRDRDIRIAQSGETGDDKDRILMESIGAHYTAACERAQQLKSESTDNPPIVATGHLFTAGGKTVEGDGVRDLYVGSLAHVQSSVFPDCIDYLALGHLHSAQKVAGSPTRVYCGSPLPMSFGEAGKDKFVLAASFSDGTVDVENIPVPCFQQLHSIRGDFRQVVSEIDQLKKNGQSVWLEVLLESDEILPNLQMDLQKEIKGSDLEILRIVNCRLKEQTLARTAAHEDLETMSEEDVFRRCLASREISGAGHDELLSLFRETLKVLGEEDALADE